MTQQACGALDAADPLGSLLVRLDAEYDDLMDLACRPDSLAYRDSLRRACETIAAIERFRRGMPEETP